MRTLALLLLAACVSIARADDWSTADTVRQGALTALLVADWAQTRWIVKNPGDVHERNLILGPHPSTGQVNNYFAMVAVGHAAVSYTLPRDWSFFGLHFNPREAWSYVWIGVELETVRANYVGIRYGF